MTTQDSYPTRKSDKFQLIERLKSINPEFSPFYSDYGYTTIPGFIDSVAAAKAECEAIFNGDREAYRNNEPGSIKLRSALNVHGIPAFREIMDNITPIAREILKDDVYIHQSRINYKAGRDANGWNWHSDFETWHAKDGMPGMDCLTAMVAIDDNTVKNGCLYVLPKSHQVFVSCPMLGDVNPDDEFSEQKEGVPSDEMIKELCEKYNVLPIPIECSKGDLVIFDCNTLHYSGANNTDDKRTNLYFVFNAVSNALVNPFSDDKHRPEAMGSLKIEKL